MAAGLKTKNPYTLTQAYQKPGSRQGPLLDERPATRNSEVLPPSRNGETVPLSRQGERPRTQQGQQDRSLEHITLFPDNEGYVSRRALITSLPSIQFIYDINRSSENIGSSV